MRTPYSGTAIQPEGEPAGQEQEQDAASAAPVVARPTDPGVWPAWGDRNDTETGALSRPRVEIATGTGSASEPERGAPTDYTDDPIGYPDQDELFGWGRLAEERVEVAGKSDVEVAREEYLGGEYRSSVASAPDELGLDHATLEARGRAAALLEELAREIRAGRTPQPTLDSISNPEGVLAVVLAALLGRAASVPFVLRSESPGSGLRAP